MTKWPGRNSFLVYLGVRPWGLASAFRLYLDYTVAVLTRLLRLRKRLPGKSFPGSFMIGRSGLTVLKSGIVFRIRPRTSDLYILSGEDAPQTAELFRPAQGQIVIDVGAHIGRFSLAAARSGAKLVAVEPNPDNYLLLRENLEKNGIRNALCLNVALSNKLETRELHYFREDGATSSLRDNWLALRGRPGAQTRVAVKCRTLDSILDEFGIQHIDWLKIDVEGSEIQVLEGGLRALAVADNLVLEVSRGNESLCLGLTGGAGFRLLHHEEGPVVSNWYLQGQHCTVFSSEPGR